MIAVYLLIALQVADIATTLYFLKHTTLIEGNPILRKLFDQFGAAPTLLVAKGAFVVLLWVSYPYLSGYEWMLWPICAFYVWVVVYNLKMIKRHPAKQ
jgi:hypothetical protein